MEKLVELIADAVNFEGGEAWWGSGCGADGTTYADVEEYLVQLGRDGFELEVFQGPLGNVWAFVI